MNSPKHPAGVCAVSGRTLPMGQLVPLHALRLQIADFLRAQHPDLQPDSLISREAINNARLDHVRALLQDQLGELSHLDEAVLQSLREHELLTAHPADEAEADASSTFGERVADRIASFGGSWTFILSFAGFLLVWILVNVIVLATRAFDPYPFILLNLLLSCLAALQAPVIMMSQNRQESRDRRRAENDYKVNLKAELEIRHLHEKMDFLLHQHAMRLMEVQQTQLELMREVTARSSHSHGSVPSTSQSTSP